MSRTVETSSRPEWSAVITHIGAAHARCEHAVRSGGTAALLTSLGPVLRWDPPVLSADYPNDLDIRLGGRGLRLIPSYFCWRYPVALADPTLPPVLVYARAPAGLDTARPPRSARRDAGRSPRRDQSEDPGRARDRPHHHRPCRAPRDRALLGQ
ncbi:hypothetical protein [Amycolatopsis arida]|uniref:hypothetical protein n=1 Tax=Amycolatopsis arida TaxID=587909 RepID=UPI001FBA5000|nr:hypothetical protein [Amycolatopsis arida]